MAEPADLLIVGAGPSAIRALVELDAALMGEPAVRPLDVVVIEPYLPGAGAVWDPDQPDHLLMNVGSGIVDFRCPSVPLSLVEWLGDEAEKYPPRNRVGRYLQVGLPAARGVAADDASPRTGAGARRPPQR